MTTIKITYTDGTTTTESINPQKARWMLAHTGRLSGQAREAQLGRQWLPQRGDDRDRGAVTLLAITENQGRYTAIWKTPRGNFVHTRVCVGYPVAPEAVRAAAEANVPGVVD